MVSSSPPVEVYDHDPGWALSYRRYEGAIRHALGGIALRIEHIGSTAVPGLAAKPVIDIQVSVADVRDLDAYRPGLESIGMRHRRHPEVIEAREFFRPDGPRVVHVHVVDAGSELERLYLLHRDYLRAHPDAATEYASLKRSLAATHRHARQRYQEAKEPFILRLTFDAEAWAWGTGWW